MNAELNRRILDALDAGRGDDPATRPPPGCTPPSTSPRTSPCCPARRWRVRPRSAAGATIGPDTTLKDVEVGEGATVVRTHGELSVIGAGRRRRPVRAACGPAPTRRQGQDRHLRGDQERADRPTARRCRTSPTSATPRSARRQHRRRGDLRQLRRGHQVHHRRSATTASSAATPSSPHRCRSVTARSSPRGRRSPATSVPVTSAWPGASSATSAGWVLRKRAGTKIAAAAQQALDTGPSADDPATDGSDGR